MELLYVLHVSLIYQCGLAGSDSIKLCIFQVVLNLKSAILLGCECVNLHVCLLIIGALLMELST